MSIITDALKKVQKKRLLANDPYQKLLKYPFPGNAENPEKPRKPLSDKASHLNGPLGISIIILLVITLGGVTGILLQRIRSEKPETGAPLVQQANKPFIYKNPTTGKKPFDGGNDFALVSVRGNSLPVLSGVMYSPRNPQALINGRIVSEGDKIGKFTLIRIYPSSVKVSSEGEEFELKLE